MNRTACFWWTLMFVDFGFLIVGAIIVLHEAILGILDDSECAYMFYLGLLCLGLQVGYVIVILTRELSMAALVMVLFNSLGFVVLVTVISAELATSTHCRDAYTPVFAYIVISFAVCALLFVASIVLCAYNAYEECRN